MESMIPSGTLAKIARQIGRPFWAYDAPTIRRQIDTLRQFDTIRYAQKANSNLHILRLIRDSGVHVDAVSLGEIERALLSGYDPKESNNPIVFTADIIDRATLQRVIDLGIPVNCGSPDMLEQIGQAHPGHPVWIRVNPGFGHGHSAKTNTGGKFSKHGIWHEYVGEAVKLLQRHGLKLVGIHMHIGSGVDYQHLQAVCESMVAQVKALSIPIDAISAGGGLSTPYRDGDPEIDTNHYFEVWDAARREIEGYLGKKIRLEIEPGRYLVAQSGYLVAEVYAVKRVAENYFVLVDSGFNDLVRPTMYGSYHQMAFIDKATGLAVETSEQSVAIAGPLCEAGDVFTQSEGGQVTFRQLPLPSVGDLLVVHDVGAYGATMSSNYNSKPLIHEVLIDGASVDVIREAQDIHQLLALEQERRALFP